ncbi:MAG: DNA polymerase III subunit delta [Firmicutes bacterium]|nr:DNA polymerase III subunit delta [Bacillota bacterium]
MNNNFLIYGEDEFLIKNNIKKIINSKNKENTSVIYYDMSEVTIEEVLEELNTFDLFDNDKIVICEKSIFLTGEGKKDVYNVDILLEYLSKASNNNVLIITNSNIDERRKIVKDIKKYCNVIKCDKLKDYEIEDYILKRFQKVGYRIDTNSVNLIFDRVGNDLTTINNEIKKLVMYKLDSKLITEEDVLKLVPKRVDDNIFDLIDAVVENDKRKIFELYEGLTNYYGEEPTKIIVMISNQFRLMLQCKILNNNGMGEKEIADYLKIHPYRIKLSLQKSKSIKKEELERYLVDLANLDINIKSGKTNKNIGLELFFLNM